MTESSWKADQGSEKPKHTSCLRAAAAVVKRMPLMPNVSAIWMLRGRSSMKAVSCGSRENVLSICRKDSGSCLVILTCEEMTRPSNRSKNVNFLFRTS